VKNPSMDFENPPIVTVFGAGVAGLSVAHELAERGLKVVIYEPAESPTEEYSCQVGGMAANQLGRVIDLQGYRELLIESGIKPDAINIPRILLEESASSMRPVQRCFPLTHRIRFKKDPKGDLGWLDWEDEFGTKNCDKLCDVLSKLREAYKEYKKDQEIVKLRLGSLEDNGEDLELAILKVRILGYTDTDGLPEKNRAESERWAGLVRDELVNLNCHHPELEIPHFAKRLSIQGRGAEAPLGDQVEQLNRERSNRVEFQIVEQRIPGEHGYRFFPSFYRHLFDTMKRTPVFDKRGDLTAETAYDQLVSTPDPSIGFSDGEGLIPVKLRRFTTLRDLQQAIEFFKEKAKFTDRDLLRLQTHFLKYLTSCKQRRANEAEDISLWQYIGADRVKYSDAAENFIKGAPQALVAMSAKETDARTQYNALIQMLVQNPFEEFVADKTLNASTSEAWLTRWKAYLKLKGVQFYIGRLERLVKSDDEFLPVVTGPKPRLIPEHDNSDFDPHDPTKEPDYVSNFFVMALPFDEASRVIWDAWSQIREDDAAVRKFTGPFQQLLNFDIFTGRRTAGGALEPRRRDPRTGQPTNPRDPLRDISGIQYFMPAYYRFGKGHVYYCDSPWGLTSISQLAFWRDRVKPIGTLRGQASFDIGNWYAHYIEESGPHREKSTAWNSTRKELADNTWSQALAAIEKLHARSLVLPQYYHLDQGIRFAIGPLELNGRATTMAAFRANAILKIKSALSGKSYKIDLYGERETPISVESTPATGNRPEDLRNDLREAITRSGVAVAEALDHDKLIISPLVHTRHALITVTGPSHRKFEVLLQGTHFPVNGMHGTLKDEGAIAKELFEAIKRNCPQDCRVAMHGDTTIAIFSKASPDRHGSDLFSVAVFNADNRIDLADAPRLTLGLDVPIDPKDRQPLMEIPVESLQNTLALDNANPYIINLPGQWVHRPGLRASEGVPHGGAQNFVWYDSPMDSLFRRWVPAGTFMATYTRLTTMESANESARHAVNAILHKTLESSFPLSKEQGKLIGDFCEIWDPEDCEPPDIAPFKDLDEALMREGLPHILDVFRVIEFVENLPDDVSLAAAFEQLRKLVDSQHCFAAPTSLIGLDAFESAVRAHLASLRLLLSGGLFG
jgi:hypothetical protein